MTDNEFYDKVHNLVIAGSGPAGLTAAIYAARADLNPVLVEGFKAGGQLEDTTDVENYPGFPKGIMGPELIEQMRAQAERFGTRFVSGLAVGDIKSVDFSSKPFQLNMGDGKVIRTHAFIIATGASAKWLGIGDQEMSKKGSGVSACATCDGFLYKGKELVVVGGGDTAMEEANFLTKFATKVYVLHRRDELRASKIMQQRAMDNPKIEFVWNSAVSEILLDDSGSVRGVKWENTQTGEISELACQGLFVAIGHKPNTAFLGGQLETDETGYLIVKDPSTATSIDGVFAAGDVSDKNYRQAITAAGTGCRAAIDAERWLAEHVGD